MRTRLAAYTLILGGTLVLAACTQVTRELRHFPELFNPSINLTEYNYGAADALVGQARGTLSLSTPVGIGVLYPVNLKPGEKVPPFGKVTADQIGTRFVQLGYTVRDLGLSLAEASRTTERAWIERGRENGSDVLLTGNYTISEYDILVNLRLLSVKTGHIIAATDYRLPLGSDTYPLLGRDPYFALAQKPQNNPDARTPGSPLPSRDLPVRIVP